MGIATSAMVAAWLTAGTVNMLGGGDRQTEAELARMTAQVQALKADTAALKGSIATTAERIEARQKFLDALLGARSRKHSGAMAMASDLVPPAATGTDAIESGVLAPFAALEARQSALVDRAAASAVARIRDAEMLIGRLGMSPSRFVAQSAGSLARGAMGGPYVPATGADPAASGADPRFAELFVNWQRVAQLQSAMAAIPAYVPIRNYMLTSSFGFRYDPFHGGAATHTGLDMAGSTGEPVMAAASGTVVRAGRFGAYGNAIDIDHGRGITTRYGHLSRINVKVGEKVDMGERIGAVGSTGRSTGPHLHYEVRIDGRAVNPRPFIEASSYILAYQKDPVGPQQLAGIDN
jgi:murein DD-endopeptidase MepM/ murein hydrolase activator NlpD